MRAGLSEAEALQAGSLNPRSSWRAFVAVAPFLRPFLRQLGLVSLADIALTFLFLIPPFLTAKLIDEAFPQRDAGLAGSLVLAIFGTALATQAIRSMREFVYGAVDIRLRLNMRNAMVRRLQALSLETVEARPIGQYLYRSSIDSDRVADVLVRVLPTLNMVVEFAIILAVSTYVDPLITSIVLLFLVPWAILFTWVTNIGRVLDRRRLRCAELRDAGMLQGLSSMDTVKAFGRQRSELRKFTERATATQRVANTGYLILVGFEFVTQRLLPYLRQTLVFLYFAKRVVGGEMTLGATVPMIAYLNRINYPIERIINFVNWVRQVMVSAERMMQILDVRPEILSPLPAPRVAAAEAISLQAVTAERSGRVVLDQVSLDLRRGETVAVVGPSGAGKSSLISTVLRLVDPASGRVVVGGLDLRQLDLQSYLNRTATVLQDTFLFSGSLRDNLRFARPDASDDELRAALVQVDLLDWFLALPAGLDSDLQSGTALSVGQRQRLGIARALLNRPDAIFFDEPTSALDAQTEQELMQVIRSACEGRIAILVTHHVAAVRWVDRVVVLDQGRIVQQGPFEQLERQPGLFRQLLGESPDALVSQP